VIAYLTMALCLFVERRLVAVDGFDLDLPDTPANGAQFGGPRPRHPAGHASGQPPPKDVRATSSHRQVTYGEHPAPRDIGFGSRHGPAAFRRTDPYGQEGPRRMTRRASRTPADEVLLAAVRAAMGMSVRAADALGDVSTVQLRALTVLQENPGTNLLQLSEAMGVTVSTTSRLVDRLVAARLVDRRQSPQTRREISLFLTRTGRARVKRYDDLRLSSLRACLERLPDEQQEAVVAALRLLVHIEAPAGRAEGGVAPSA